jgi:hypothetical protein
VRGVRSALANNKGQQGELKEFSWSSVLKLCSWIVQESQPSPECETTDDSRDSDLREARRAVADLLRVGFAARGNSGIPLHFRSEVWNIIEPLTHDPDPTPEREKGYSTPTDKSPRDLSDLSINTVRGEAMHTVVRYALWLRRHFEQMPDGSELIGRGFNEMPEVRQVFNEHLDLDRDTSLAIRSVYGQWFPWLMMLDGGWATQNVAKIFPHDEALSDLRSAAWESYIRYCSVYDNVFDLLQEEYNYAVERSNTACSKKQQLTELEEGLAEHLMTFYWRGKLRLDEPRGLLTLFYTEVPDVFRGYALEFVGRSLRNTEDAIEPQILNRLQLLWERRLEAARAATLPTSYINELAAFGWWFASAKFDDSWAIAQLKEVLQLIGQVEPDFLIFERLAALADKMPESTVECLKLIIEKDKNGLGIYGSDDEVKTILATAIQGSSDTARQTAIELINRLGQCGNWEFRELLSIES